MISVGELKVRDPFIWVDREAGRYVLYRSHYIAYRPEVGKDEIEQKIECFMSDDLVEWEEAGTVFCPGDDFWGTYDFWAPEVHYYNGGYYLIATFKADGHARGCHVFRADDPLGPFVPVSDSPITPAGWECLDATLFVDDGGEPWLVFCHEWLQVGDGTMEAMRVSGDLTYAVGEPVTLFTAGERSWAKAISAGGKNGYVTDGPFFYRNAAGGAVMIWSSFGSKGYVVAQCRCGKGTPVGEWEHAEEPLLNSDGGHGMIFETLEGELMLALHGPNSPYRVAERLKLYRLVEKDGWLAIAE